MRPSLLLLLACTGSQPEPSAANPHDHGAGAPPAESLDAFASAYRAALQAHGRAPCTWQHDSAALRCPDGSRHDVRGLWAWVAEGQDAAGRAARAEGLLELVGAVDRVGWPGHAHLLRLRLGPEVGGTARALAAGHPEGLQLGLELAVPGGIVPLTDAAAERWSADPTALEQAAADNLRRVDPKPFWPLAEGAARARVGDGYDAERLVLASAESLGFAPRHAVVVPGQLSAVADEAGLAVLDELVATWQAEHPAAPAWRLVLDPQGAWVPAAAPP